MNNTNSEIKAMRIREPLLRISGDSVFLLHDRGEYEIALSSFSSLRHLLPEIYHLKDKNWMSLDHLISMLDLVKSK
jgi:hypothetical protein